MSSQYNESFVQEIIKKTQDDLEWWEKRIREKSKPHWWSISKKPEASDLQRCEDLRRTIPYLQSWRVRLTAAPKFPANGRYTQDARRAAVATLQREVADLRREAAPANVCLTYSRRHYEPNDNGGGGPGRWVSDKPGNRFDQLKQLLTDKINEEIKSLETA